MGASGHGKVIADILRASVEHELVGFVDRRTDRRRWCGLPILGADGAIEEVYEEYDIEAAVVAIGHNGLRATVVERIERILPGLAWANAIHPAAHLGADVDLSAGIALMAAAAVNPGTRVGRHVIVNTAASVDHDCDLGDFSSVAPGAVLGGDVTLGEGVAVSIGATVVHRVTIGSHSLVGAGAVVLEDLPPNVVAYGVPARVVRERTRDDPYL